MPSKAVFQKLNNKYSRYRKTLAPLLKILLGKSGVDFKRKTVEIIGSTEKSSRNFFKARVYTLSQLFDKIRAASPDELKKDEARELLETFPLFVNLIVMTGERCCIGKIDNEPFDIFIAPERLVEIRGKSVEIHAGLYIQTKRLIQYPLKPMETDEWMSFLERTIEEKIISKDYGLNGHVHLYNEIPFSDSTDIKTFRRKLKKLNIRPNKHVDSISVSLELLNKNGRGELVTWLIYPYVPRWVDVLDLDLMRANHVYAESAALQMLLRRYKELHSGV